MSPTMRDAAASADLLRNSSADDWGLDAAQLGVDLEHVLWEPHELVRISRLIASEATRQGCTHIVGASPLGDRLAAAMLALSEDTFRGTADFGSGSRVGIVEGLVSTGWTLRQTAERILDSGVDSVIAIAVLSAIDSESLSDSIGPVITIDP